ncbi:MBOAT family O-acyltransferase [Phaeocystidibacter luteus]|uniref:MBOAT family protein n=1 Tax=Phaeocystidibacter luteus TaxID=911197 RepID=A0A6N6RLP4_9FLAO|nr:MBOAT family protein [Phaeocystidibacter luteus]KAB2814496.1 MBOAT family protein [Phaeocystidibacter luteus]
MLFNSIDFVLFLPVFFAAYWLVQPLKLKWQNLIVLTFSYLFYSWWDIRFTSLIILSTIIDYAVGLQLQRTNTPSTRKLLLGISMAANLGMLGFFKYYNFFVDSFADAFSYFGMEFSGSTLDIVLPVGISFYTFQTMSYTIDVYRRQLEPTRDFIAFAAFVSFFPQLVAGPIERASNLLPQMLKRRYFDYAKSTEGIRLILWGLFKKIAISDALAPSVNHIFENYGSMSAGTLVLGAVFFAFQIYGDFSGYSDIARGLAKLLGFELMLNFNLPYFSRNIAEFWRRWHISLSTWFRDYLYIPLGGSRVDKNKAIRNVFIVFLVSGFWHGANWTFLAWGGIHAMLFIPSFIIGTNRKHLSEHKPVTAWMMAPADFGKVLLTFAWVCIAWIFFRAPSIGIAGDYIYQIFTFSGGDVLSLNPYDNQPFGFEVVLLILFVFIEYGMSIQKINLYSSRVWARTCVDVALILAIILSIPIDSAQSFIYFQF